MEQNVAAIDIGTNTILLHIATIDDSGKIHSIRDEHRIARLGENLSKTSGICPAAIGRACTILSEYAEICKSENVKKIRIVATSAMREANNSQEVIAEFQNVINGDFQIISGEEEASLSFIGTVEDREQSTVIDIGGGSTEFIIGSYDKIINRISLKLGAIKLSEQFLPYHPPTPTMVKSIRNAIRDEFADKLKVFNSKKIYAVAGTPVTIASVLLGERKFNEEIINGRILSISDIEEVLTTFLSNDLDYLVNNLEIHRKRADVITAGTIILLEALRAIGKYEIIVSTKGLRYGVIKSMTIK